MTLNEFIAKNDGVGLDFDGYYGDQCVDLAQFYNRDVLGNDQRFAGNAADIYGQQPDKFDWTRNTPSGVPQTGDIMIWGSDLNGGPGHIAVFLSGDANHFTSFDQNWPLDSNCHRQNHDYSHVLGWGHFKNSEATKPEVKENIAVNSSNAIIRQSDIEQLGSMILGKNPFDHEWDNDLEMIDIRNWVNQQITIEEAEHRFGTMADRLQLQTIPVTVTPVPEDPTPVKPGNKSSEFYLVIAGAVITFLNAQFNLHIPQEQVLGFLGVIGSYVVGRSIVKAKQ